MHKTVTGRQTGFTMLEVLISMVIVAFGLLGVAGLQAFALKNNQSASLRNAAAVLANDIADRMRANPVGALDNAYHQPNIAVYSGSLANCAVACTTAQIAANDLIEWQTRIAATLPSGAGIVCVDSTPLTIGAVSTDPQCDNTGATNYVVKIWWADNRNQAATVAVPLQRFSTTFNP